MKRVFWLVIMIGDLQLFALSCRDNKQEEKKDDYEFYYYPEKNVYYDVEKKNFFYSLDGGKTWDSTINPSGNDPGTLGKEVIIRSLGEVYNDNETHRNLYNGKLYNIINLDTRQVTTAPEVSERKVQKKRTTAIIPRQEDKLKKGLKKFLDKIFAKRKKKQEQQ